MPEQKKSKLLTQDENDNVFDLLGFKCQTMSTTVIELYTTAGPTSGDWIHKDTGVLCLVKDHNKRSYFFRLYCPVRKMLLWEHEIYNDIQYLTPTSFLHTFEAEILSAAHLGFLHYTAIASHLGFYVSIPSEQSPAGSFEGLRYITNSLENCIAGFNFASEDEGKILQKTLQDILEFKNQKRVERRNRYNNSISKTAPVMNGGINMMDINVNSTPHHPPVKVAGKSGHKKISKADISEPTDFRHVSHVGWNPNTGFDLDKVDDPQLKAFFQQAGVSETHLKDKETREFIYDFISRNGGIEAVKEEMDPPPIPQRIRSAPPRPPSRPGPPPPPPIRVQPPRTMPNATKPVNSVVTETTNFPPPPPPPPPPGPPPPPMMADMSPNPTVDFTLSPSAALMEELTKNRKQLKPLNLEKEQEEKRLPPSMATDSHFQLMDQIKEGIKLKPVSAPTNQPTVPSGGLASALAKALAERSKVIYSDSSSTSDTDEADDEWD